ncbi:MAG: DUF2293 domain-containing protein [Lentisphaeria bacterium]
MDAKTLPPVIAGHEPVLHAQAHSPGCAQCRAAVPAGALVRPAANRGVLCLECADLGGLEFLPSGDVTRRAQQHSRRWAPVVEWNRRRKRYERRGTLVEPAALRQAVAACAADAGRREAKRQADGHRREREELRYRAEFAQMIQKLFPGAPDDVAGEVAAHACEKSSGRVGRCAAAKDFSEKAVTLAVVAHVRHLETSYDRLLAMGYSRERARERIRERLQDVLAAWRRRPAAPRSPAAPPPLPPLSTGNATGRPPAAPPPFFLE